MVRVEFREWDDRIALVHTVSHVLGPVSDGHPIDIYALWALFYARPTLFLNAVINIEAIDEIIVLLSEGGEIDKLRERYPYVFELVESVKIPEKLREAVIRNYNTMKDFLNDNSVIDDVLSLFPGIVGKVTVYPSFEVGKNSTGGTVYASKIIVMSFGWGSMKPDIMGRTFVHEFLHVLEGRASDCKELLEKVNKTLRLPVHEAFTEVLTNYVWYRLGFQEEMFESYYKKRWERLVEVEDFLREEVKKYDRGEYNSICDVLRALLQKFEKN